MIDEIKVFGIVKQNGTTVVRILQIMLQLNMKCVRKGIIKWICIPIATTRFVPLILNGCYFKSKLLISNTWLHVHLWSSEK